MGKSLATRWVEVTMRYARGERGSTANKLVTNLNWGAFVHATHVDNLEQYW